MLSCITFNYNTSVHATTRQVLFQMMHRRQATLPFDQQHEIMSLAQDPEYSQKIKDYLGKLTEDGRKNILKSQQQYQTRYNVYKQDLLLKIDDLVLVETRKIRRSQTFIVQYIKKLTLTRQVTTDILIPLFERWNLTK